MRRARNGTVTGRTRWRGGVPYRNDSDISPGLSGQQDEAPCREPLPLVTAACSMVRMLESLPFTEADVRLAAGARSFGRGGLRMERNLMKILDQNGL